MKTLLCLFTALSLFAAPAKSQKHQLSGDMHGSQLSALGSVIVVAGSVDGLANAGQLIVKGVEKVGDSVLLVVEGASQAGRVTLRLSGTAVGAVSLVAGTTLSVVTMASGYALVAAGQLIAFFPNEAGKALMHQSRYQAPGR